VVYFETTMVLILRVGEIVSEGKYSNVENLDILLAMR
jgi:hypothetical protein